MDEEDSPPRRSRRFFGGPSFQAFLKERKEEADSLLQAHLDMISASEEHRNAVGDLPSHPHYPLLRKFEDPDFAENYATNRFLEAAVIEDPERWLDPLTRPVMKASAARRASQHHGKDIEDHRQDFYNYVNSTYPQYSKPMRAETLVPHVEATLRHPENAGPYAQREAIKEAAGSVYHGYGAEFGYSDEDVHHIMTSYASLQHPLPGKTPFEVYKRYGKALSGPDTDEDFNLLAKVESSYNQPGQAHRLIHLFTPSEPTGIGDVIDFAPSLMREWEEGE